ncbi:MAG: insulinase family protein [Lachnospiraceae bacterium]|nr:insulinase family protein [Lachnospiraceae bacterium]
MESNCEKKPSGGSRTGIENLTAYEVISHEYLPDIDSDSWLLRHKKTGARVALLPRNDNNKVFFIAFRTPPEDSTGVAHIIEHTVLCGSREFPIKDPFIELAKGSLNTFLNAMTYPDKTVYPVASCNDRDFKNLMHVYLDAVFYPNIYREQNIFRQEGWHYEADSADGDITVNGVVYNEMKGALSNPEDILGREINSALYPHTPYFHESGGDPVNIPDLTYEAYLDFHRRYYHPSNSYIYLYGDADMAERLQWIDEAYLSHFDRLEIDSTIPAEPAFEEPVAVRRAYSILPEEDPAGKSFLSWNVTVAPDSLDAGFNTAFQILNYALCDAEGAPVRKALRDKGLGEDVYASFETGIRQPSFSIVSKYTDPDRRDEFIATIRETLQKLAEDGIDRRALEAGINRYEFRYREADFGSYSKGLIYGLSALETWLYDDEKPFVSLQVGDCFDKLRKEAGRGYFEKIIRERLLDNTHCAVVVLEPEPGLSDRRDEEMRIRLKKFADSCTAQERQQIVDDFKALRTWQQTPDAEEDIRMIPMLQRSDLTRKAVPLLNVVRDYEGMKAIIHPQSTNRIDYMTFLFDIRDLPEKYIRLLGIFKTLFSVLDTEKYDYTALGHEINISTGGLGALTSSYNWYGDPQIQKGSRLTFEVSLKALHKNLRPALDLVRQILLRTNYNMPDRILEVLEEERAGMRAGMSSSGHATAAQRALSYISENSAIMDLISGLGAYETLDRTCEKLSGSGQAEELCADLADMARAIFRTDNLTFDCTACEEDIPEILACARDFAAGLNPPPAETRVPFVPVLKKKNEGLTTAGQVQYVCRAGRYKGEGRESTGVFRVLRVLMGYEYLWGKVRVEGGAYGCMSSFTRDGSAFLVSYRDPHLRRTIRTFEEAADFLRSFDADERTMTKYIIGAVSALDQPMTPYVYGRYSLSSYLTGLTDEKIQKERDQVLDATPADIRAMAPYLDAVMAEDCICVVGSDAKIRENKELFGEIRKLV